MVLNRNLMGFGKQLWFAFPTECSHILYIANKTHSILPPYHICEVNYTVPAVYLSLEPVITVQAVQTKKSSVLSALSELNLVLASISTTVQGFHLPVMLGCVSMLRTLNNRWKSNEPAILVNGNVNGIYHIKCLYN